LLGGGPLSALDSVAPADVAPEDAEVTVPESGLSAARAAMARRQTLRDEQQAFFDRIAKQLAERRTGPSTSEQLFEISAALARPTTVRGLSGVLNNVMPVLQQQAKATRVGTEGRAEALTAMQLAQNRGAMDLADQEVETELKLAELMAKANKAPATGETERLIARAMKLPEGSPERKLILGAIRGSPEQMAAILSNKVAGIVATAENRPLPAGSRKPPEYARAPGGNFKKWVP
jgi:hypothetical protein